jgi:hypothetical protein
VTVHPDKAPETFESGPEEQDRAPCGPQGRVQRHLQPEDHDSEKHAKAQVDLSRDQRQEPVLARPPEMEVPSRQKSRSHLERLTRHRPLPEGPAELVDRPGGRFQPERQFQVRAHLDLSLSERQAPYLVEGDAPGFPLAEPLDRVDVNRDVLDRPASLSAKRGERSTGERSPEPEQPQTDRQSLAFRDRGREEKKPPRREPAPSRISVPGNP